MSRAWYSLGFFAALASLSASPAAAQMPSAREPLAPRATFNAEQRAEIAARIELANAIVQNVADDAQSRGLPDSWRMNLLATLYTIPRTGLQNMATTTRSLGQAYAQSRETLATLRTAASPAKSLAAITDSLAFTAIPPCRFIDTRNVAEGPIVAPRDYDTVFTGAQYGGNAACQIPHNVDAAIAANVTVVVSAAGPAGYVSIRPIGSTAVTSFINWPATGTLGLANAGIITTSKTVSGNQGFEVFASGAKPDLIVDFFGYFAPASSLGKDFDCVAATGNSITLVGGETNASPAPSCPSGYIAVTPNCISDDPRVVLIGSYINGGTRDVAVCKWHNTGGSQSGTVYSSAQCCRTAGY